MAANNSTSDHGQDYLIGPDEPPAVTLLNEQGQAKVLLVGDHVSNLIPGSLQQLGLEDAILQEHVAYDIGTHKLLQKDVHFKQLGVVIVDEENETPCGLDASPCSMDDNPCSLDVTDNAEDESPCSL